MPRGDFYGGKNMGLPMRTREAPTRAFAVLDKGRSLAPTSRVAPGTTQSLKDTRVRHAEDKTPVGYSQMFEAYVPYTKDRWCSPSCQCLHYAAASGDVAMTVAAAEGKKPFTRKHGMEEMDPTGRTAIMIAAWKGHAKCVQWLAEHGASLNAVDKRNRTVAHWACLSTRTYESLVPLCGKNMDVSKKDLFGDTCLHRVVKDRDFASAELLCQHFPRLTTIKDKSGKLPMELARPHKELMHAVSPQAAAEHVQQEKDKMLRLALEMEEFEKQEIQRQQREEYEEMTNKRRASVAGAAGIQGAQLRIRHEKMETLTLPEPTADPIPDENDDWAALEGGRSLQSMAEEEELGSVAPSEEASPIAAGEANDNTEEDEENVSFFSSMVDVVENKRPQFTRREIARNRGRRNRKQSAVKAS